MAKSKKKSIGKPQVTPAPKVPEDNISDINSCVIAAALNSVNHPVLLKVCRLCGAKDGPFLNIFDPEQVTARKVDQLMPFRIAENDELPHKICFRCSAKVEELHEFVEKCVRTQGNLHETMGKKAPIISKTRTRALWEDKLNKSNMSNDDICDAVIKKAMAGIKNINPLTLEEEKAPVVSSKSLQEEKTKTQDKPPAPLLNIKQEVKDSNEESDPPLKQGKLSIDKCDPPTMSTRSTRSINNLDKLVIGSRTLNNLDKLPVELEDKKTKSSKDKNITSKEKNTINNEKNIASKDKNTTSKEKNSKKVIDQKKDETTPIQDNTKITSLSFDYDGGPNENIKKQEESAPQTKAFDIMDHVCMIKVNGVGILFQCKLCNRNFLKKEVVLAHSCAKNGVPKVDFSRNIPPPEPPKIPAVKYINTKIDGELKKPIITDRPAVPIVKPIVPEVKPKPRIGPASKVKQTQNIDDPSTSDTSSVGNANQAQVPTVATSATIVNFPSAPKINGRFRLVPGPDNTFTLVEDQSRKDTEESNVDKETNVKPSKKRKSDIQQTETTVEQAPVTKQTAYDKPLLRQNSSAEKPYPVGLFQTSLAPEPPVFTTPAMKKHSYTIVQTGNPSKLLISTKAQPLAEEPVKKRTKKAKTPRKPDVEVKEPYSVTLEDDTPPKESGIFTFINVDPLLQPSYVLPTYNIIQESQITTSTSVPPAAIDNKEKDKYSCNMCSETFSREKKLLSHIQSHYSKMDEEDQLRAERSTRKRGRKS